MKMINRGISILITVMFVAVLAFAPAKVSAAEQTTPSGIAYGDISKSIAAYAKEHKNDMASFSTATFDRSGILTIDRYGYTDIENGVKADENTVYEWGSTSKTLIWVSVMQLYEKGLVDFDTDIREYLPEGFLTKLQYPEEKITLVNLMNHNAGFQESIYENQETDENGLYSSLEEAVIKCQCYQAFHVGENTAYTNWGSALAAYIVERVSGQDYVTYVNENIFEPVGMKHTSVDMHMSDNEWVREQREKIHCYESISDSEPMKDLGVCHSWVQLYPAGCVTGTIDDIAAFAQGFVSPDCPFFEDNATRDLMLSPTSYFGGSDIAKVCHGLWSEQFKVSTIGHGGNTMGMTANIQFDPESGFGIVVLANKEGEKTFCTGLCRLMFGDFTDGALVASNPVKDHTDISGEYTMARGFFRGFGSAIRYASGYTMKATDDPDVFNMPLTGGAQMVHIGDKMWQLKSSDGNSVFCYESVDAAGNPKLEIMSTDLVKANPLGTISFYAFLLLTLGCILTLFIKLVVMVIRKIRGKEKIRTLADRQITVQQIIQGVSGVILFLMINNGVHGHALAVFSCIMASLLGLASLANGGMLVKNTVGNSEILKRTAVKRYIWAAIAVLYLVFIIGFQLYDFIHI